MRRNRYDIRSPEVRLHENINCTCHKEKANYALSAMESPMDPEQPKPSLWRLASLLQYPVLVEAWKASYGAIDNIQTQKNIPT